MTATNIVVSDEVKPLIERIERLEEERRSLTEAIKEVYVEAKSKGHHVPGLKLAIKKRAMTGDKVARAEETETMAELYRSKVESFDNTALARASAARPTQTDSHTRAVS